MTWRSLLSSTRSTLAPPAAKPQTPATVAPATETPQPPAPELTPPEEPSTAPPNDKSSDGFFELPSSPRLSLAVARQRQQQQQQQETNETEVEAIVAPASSPKIIDPNSPEARWEPPSNGFLNHHQQKPPIHPPNSDWFIDVHESQPIATSPVKRGAFFPLQEEEEPSSVDRQKARLLFSQDFREGIERLEEERQKVQYSFYDSGGSSPKHSPHENVNVRVFVRKRPMPTDCGEDFDVVRTESELESSTPSLVLYNTEIKHDLRKKQVKPAIFGPFDSCFGDKDSDSNHVYQRSVKSLVEAAKSGGIATLLLLGQSQTGKSHTLSQVQGMAARDIFTGLPYNHTVRVAVIELSLTNCRDLLDETPTRSTVRIADVEDPHGSVRFVNALALKVATPEDLLAAMVLAQKRKRANERNFGHVVCRITVVPPKEAPSGIRSGTLTLIDCAGTEWRSDRSKNTNPHQQAVVAQMNGKNAVLKRCLRAKTGNNDPTTNIPYANTSLTRCLRESMEEGTCHVIAHVSPKATDTEDTLETLCTVSSLIGGFAEEPQPALSTTSSISSSSKDNAIPPPPKAWDRAQLGEWMTRKHLIQDAAKARVPPDMTGRAVMKLSKVQLAQTFYNGKYEKGDLLYRCLRAETDRLARLEVKRHMAMERAVKKAWPEH